MPCRFATLFLAFLSFLGTAPSPALSSQKPDLVFEELSIEDGLSQSIVECIIQDDRGFIWFGTESGLNKYDGYEFTVIIHDPDNPNSLSYNHTLSICNDDPGYIWIGTFHAGLNRYDPDTGDFKLFVNDPEDSASISHNYISVIKQDRSGTLWIGTGNGLNRYERETESFTRFMYNPSGGTELGDNNVLEIYEDKSGFLWIGLDGGGLVKLDRSGNELERYFSDPAGQGSLSRSHVRAVCEDYEGFIWVGTVGGGLVLIDPATGTLRAFTHDPGNRSSLAHDEVFALYSDPSGNLWIGTNGGGLDLLDRKNMGFFHYQNDPNNPRSISYNEIYDIFEDRSGVIWLGTYGGGANKFDRKRKKFSLFRPDPNNPNSLDGDIVWAIYEDDGILWIGTHGGGLNRLDRSTGKYSHYRHDPSDPYSLSNDIVKVVMKDGSGRYWIGTHGGGINRFDPGSGRFHAYRHDPEDPSSLSHDQIRSIYEDRRGVLWVGTYGGGLNRFDPESGKFKRYRNDPGVPGSLSIDFVRQIYEDSLGNLWVGTQGGGLEKLDRETGIFTHFRADPGDRNSISNDYDFWIHEDREGILWIGTMGGGLNRFDRSALKFSHYTEDEGLANNSVYCILEDNRGKLWLSTNYGLSRFDPVAGTFKNYTEEDGLQSNEFNGGSAFRSRSGELFFGGIKGLNAFFPELIRDNPYIPNIVITSISILNKPLESDKPVSEIEDLTLSYKDYVFSFEFSALDFTAPRKNQYAYRMVGLDKDWVYTGAEKRFANYTTLKPGKYIFQVKGSNNDGKWNEEGVAINITILPPFWQRAWFRLLIVAVILALGILFLNWRLKDVRIETELQAAHQAQMSIMPHADPEVEGFDISGICLPAYEVGGDFYDYIWLDRDKRKFVIAVGDVSGKAMKAAMIAVMSSGMIYSKANDATSLAKIMSELNYPLYCKTDPQMFTTLFMAEIDTSTRALTMVNAGFCDPILKSNGSVVPVDSFGSRLPLGMMERTTYSEKNISMNPGDVLILYSDGVPEALNKSHEYYDVDSLERLLGGLDTSRLKAKDIKDIIIKDVKRFAGATPQNDDMTVVVIKSL